MTLKLVKVGEEYLPHRVVLIQGDGSCLFRSLSYLMYSTEECAQEVRVEIVDYVIRNWAWNSFLSFNEAGNNYPNALLYWQDMTQPHTFGGLCELHAAGQIYPFCFEVYRNGELYTSCGDKNNPARRMLFSSDLSAGHFDVLLPIQFDDCKTLSPLVDKVKEKDIMEKFKALDESRLTVVDLESINGELQDANLMDNTTIFIELDSSINIDEDWCKKVIVVMEDPLGNGEDGKSEAVARSGSECGEGTEAEAGAVGVAYIDLGTVSTETEVEGEVSAITWAAWTQANEGAIVFPDTDAAAAAGVVPYIDLKESEVATDTKNDGSLASSEETATVENVAKEIEAETIALTDRTLIEIINGENGAIQDIMSATDAVAYVESIISSGDTIEQVEAGVELIVETPEKAGDEADAKIEEKAAPSVDLAEIEEIGAVEEAKAALDVEIEQIDDSAPEVPQKKRKLE